MISNKTAANKHEKDIHFQKKDIKSLMIEDYCNSIMMEYEKIIKMLDNTPNQSSKFRAKNWVKINDESRGTYDEDN